MRQKVEFDFRARWNDLGHRIGVTNFESWEKVFDHLVAEYSKDGRYYHAMVHVQYGLERVHLGKDVAKDLNAVETAWWFHDIFYDTSRHDNEERSARFAGIMLVECGVNKNFADKVEDMIPYTKYGKLRPTDVDTQLLLDMDLSSFAAPRDLFVKNTEDIRKEYAFVEEGLFRSTRAEILQKFLDLKPIYLTEPFRRHFEADARANLTQSIAELSRP